MTSPIIPVIILGAIALAAFALAGGVTVALMRGRSR